MTENIDLLLNGGVFDPKECLSAVDVLNELPMLNSERKAFQDKIRQLQEDLRLSQTVILHGVTRIINECDELPPEVRDLLLKEIWK